MIEQLRVHGLLPLAEGVAAQHELELGALEGHALAVAALRAAIVAAGWSERNVDRVFGLRVAVRDTTTPESGVQPSRDALRNRRHREVRAKVTCIARVPKRELRLATLMHPYPEGVERPRTRGDCVGGERPCPFVSCRWHLYLDVVEPTGNLRLNFPDIEPDELKESCVLDVADRGGAHLEQVGEYMNITREGARQIELRALASIRPRDVQRLAEAM